MRDDWHFEESEASDEETKIQVRAGVTILFSFFLGMLAGAILFLSLIH